MSENVSNESHTDTHFTSDSTDINSSSGTKRGRPTRSQPVGAFRDYSSDNSLFPDTIDTDTNTTPDLDQIPNSQDDHEDLESFRRQNLRPSSSTPTHTDSPSNVDGTTDDMQVELSKPTPVAKSDFDSEFLTLLQSFAQLDLPTYYSEEEECFMCQKVFKTVDFADHVYECIKCLEPEEKRAMEDLDYQLALQLSAQEVDEFDFLDRVAHKPHISDAYQSLVEQGMDEDNDSETQQKAAFDRFIANQALIFNQYKYHQKRKVGTVECCVCGLFVENNEIDAHVLLCLHTPPDLRLGPGIDHDQQEATEDMAETEQANQMDASDDQPTASSNQATATDQPATIPPTPVLPIHGEIRDTTPVEDIFSDEPREPGSRDGLRNQPSLLLSTSLDEDDGMASGSTAAESLSPQPLGETPSRSDIGMQPSTQQLHSMAKMVLSHTQKPTGDQGGVSLNSLLARFKSLGLNKENLKRAKNDVEMQLPARSPPQSDCEAEMPLK